MQENIQKLTNNSQKLTKALLACGVVFGPLFYLVVLIQMLTRSGFDIRRHPLSLLSLGDAGWIQITNFIVAGLLAILCAVGMRRLLRGGLGGTWGPLLIGTYGLGMITAGLFPPDPSLGFPPGAPIPETMSQHAVMHGVGFFVAFISLTAACFVYARRFISLGHRGWGFYCIATGVVTPVLIFLGMTIMSETSIFFAIVGIVAFGWIAVISARMITELLEKMKLGEGLK
ncbi:MAG: DUF998 domain-containing protein [Candidatus Methanoperedens sp.]|nr:DUF998 domain-containing protein [Candidatus Methanoperedens sp.]